jgi:hypothetical protein
LDITLNGGGARFVANAKKMNSVSPCHDGMAWQRTTAHYCRFDAAAMAVEVGVIQAQAFRHQKEAGHRVLLKAAAVCHLFSWPHGTIAVRTISGEMQWTAHAGVVEPTR